MLADATVKRGGGGAVSKLLEWLNLVIIAENIGLRGGGWANKKIVKIVIKTRRKERNANPK